MIAATLLFILAVQLLMPSQHGQEVLRTQRVNSPLLKHKQLRRMFLLLLLVPLGLLSRKLALLLGVVLLLVFTSYWIINSSKTARKVSANRNAVLHACLSLAGSLKVGELPQTAIVQLAQDHPILKPSAAAAQVACDIGLALERSSSEPGCQGLSQLASAWQLAAVTGAPLAPIVDSLAASLQRQNANERILDAELATAKASGRLFAALPLLGVLAGFLAGQNTLEFLFTKPIGQILLTVAIMLACLGLIWSDRLARQLL